MQKTLNWFEQINKRLKETGDSEPDQAKIRIIIGLFLAIYFFALRGPVQNELTVFDSAENIIVFIGICSAFLILAAILVHPRPSPTRRVVGIVSDIIWLSALLYVTGGDYLALFVLYLWVSLGNGFRFGPAYLYIACGVGLVGFSAVAYWGEFWQAHQSIAISLIVILLVLPIYAGVFLKRQLKAIADVNDANKAKSRYLAYLSPELRTPVKGVIDMAELLRETSLPFEQKEIVDKLHRSASALSKQIDNVLDIASIEAGKMDIQNKPFDLHELVNSVTYLLSAMGTAKGISVSCYIDAHMPCFVNGDDEHIRQVLISLVSHAIEFTDQGSVSLHSYRSGGTDNNPVIHFEVIDSGSGITPEYLELIFNHNTRGQEKSSQSYDGSGLDIMIGKALVGLMGGRISIESELNQGSIFRVEIPMEALSHSDSKMCNVHLLLLASEDTTAVLRPSLEQWQVNVDSVQSSTHALSLLVQAAQDGNGYGIALIDQRVLVDMSATEFAQRLNAHRLCQHLPLILIIDPDSTIDMTEIAHDYLSTLSVPVDRKALFNAIHAAHSAFAMRSKVATLADYYQRQPGSKALNILVVEDNLVNQQVIDGILNNAGHTAELVNTGQKALDSLADNYDRFDLVILDMHMPEMSGTDALKAFRLIDTAHSLPVIMLTADATPQARQLGLSAGANAFLTKPVDARILLEKITRLTYGETKAQAAADLPEPAAPSKNQIAEASAMLDESKLDELLSLGGDYRFIQSLIINFNKDGSRHIERIKKAGRDDYLEYREAIHALKGSATELGATRLAELCLTAESLEVCHIGTNEITLMTDDIHLMFIKTMTALADRLDNFRQLSPQPTSDDSRKT